jgi:hypothetical protein
MLQTSIPSPIVIRRKSYQLLRAIAQAVSRWLPTTAVRGSRPSRHVGFCGEQSGAGAGFLRVLRFPLPKFIPTIAPKIIFIINHRGYVQ